MISFCFFSGSANRGLGSLETAQDDHAEEAVKMQALSDGNQFYADCNFHCLFILLIIQHKTFFLLSNRTCQRERC